MRKQFWVLIGLLAVMLIVVSGHTPRAKLAADLGGVTFAPTGTGTYAGATTTAAASSSSLGLGFATTTTGGITAVSTTSTTVASATPAGSVDLSRLTAAITAAIDAATTGTATIAPASVYYRYKYFTNVDECTLNRYGSRGWSVLQVGTVVTDNNGGPYYAADCEMTIRGYLDWALLVKQSVPSQ